MKRAEFIDAFEQTICSATQRAIGLDGAAATAAAQQIAEEVIREFRGQMIYVPVRRHHGRKADHGQVYAEFNGSNHQELATKFGYSVQHIYRLIKSIQRQPEKPKQ